jgi:hypothetical protein
MSITGVAQWTWQNGIPTAFPFGPTKTGLLPADLQGFAGVPLVIRGNPPVALTSTQLMNFIRWAEDEVEEMVGIRLCPTWVASPPARTAQDAQAASIITQTPGQGQILGQDYDVEDAAYDFYFDRSQDEGWLAQSMRYRPLRVPTGQTRAIQSMAFIYPLLNQFYQMPTSWITEDLDNGIIRIVPNQNLQALPIFGLQLATFGTSQTVPGGIWMQYVVGLTAADYASRFSMVKGLILMKAAITALSVCQGSISMGLLETMILTDGVQTTLKYRPNGAYSDLIKNFGDQASDLQNKVLWLVGGPRMDAF